MKGKGELVVWFGTKMATLRVIPVFSNFIWEDK